MKHIIGAFFLVFITSIIKIKAQCNLTETVTICDMTVVDNDNDGNPDGIINLYDEYNAISGGSISLATGTWFDPNFNFALDQSTGDLHLWDLNSSSEASTDYQFQLLNTSTGCIDDIVITLDVVIGPFSGLVVPAININDVNVQICNSGSSPCDLTTNFDLFQTLLSVPTAHFNGVWSYEGTSPNFINIIDNKYLEVNIPYQEGVPLIDEETFELIYTVPGISPCLSSTETRVKVSVVREVFSGSANHNNICETELISGNYDASIDLRDDDFLVNEDIEGVWLFNEDASGQITGFNDSEINLKAIYNDLYQTNPRFGCATYEYSYFVESRSTVCESQTSTVSFTFFEYLRPFEQNNASPEFCVDDSNLPNSYNLNNLLEFTAENGVLYNYPPKQDYTSWSLISGPSILNLNSDTGVISLANITNQEAGTYTFRYLVSSEYHCQSTDASFLPETIFSLPDGCGNIQDANFPCDSQSATVIFTIHPKLYAGENTTGLEFCDNDTLIANPIDLFTLLGTNGVDDPIYQGGLGTWRDVATGIEFTNPITLADVNNQQTFNFEYTTLTANDCLDTATLSFTIYEEYQPGTGGSIDVCDTSASFDLFDSLTGNPNAVGTWSGPNGYLTTTHHAILAPATLDAGTYTYTVPDNVNTDGTVLCTGSSATIVVTLYQSPNAGSDMLGTVCQSDVQIYLTNYLDTSANSGGVFNDLDQTNMLSGNMLDVSQLSGTYRFQYEIQGHGSCSLSTSIISITVNQVATPSVVNQTFCVSDGPTVTNLVVSNGVSYNWYDTIDSNMPLAFNTALINGEDYFVSALDNDNCESSRISITVTLLPLDHVDCDTCLKDGVTANDDGINDVFDLCNLPVAFPNFEINIYNRYGTLVYKGNQNTALFKGESNVALTLGKGLPSGVYFYVFDPKDNATKAFQGNFYLSR